MCNSSNSLKRISPLSPWVFKFGYRYLWLCRCNWT